MVEVTDDRDKFEREIFKPPHLARMLTVSGEFTGRLDNQDREFFLAAAMDAFWEMRERIKVMNDIGRLWAAALETVASSRPRWRVFISHYGVAVGSEWVRPSQVRSKS